MYLFWNNKYKQLILLIKPDREKGVQHMLFLSTYNLSYSEPVNQCRSVVVIPILNSEIRITNGYLSELAQKVFISKFLAARILLFFKCIFLLIIYRWKKITKTNFLSEQKLGTYQVVIYVSNMNNHVQILHIMSHPIIRLHDKAGYFVRIFSKRNKILIMDY